MADIYCPQIYKDNVRNHAKLKGFQRSQGEVGQDSSAKRPEHTASRRPALKKNDARSPQALTESACSEISLTIDQKTVPLTIHCEPGVKERLLERARGATEKKLATLSGMGNALLKRALSLDPDKPYGPTLEPVVRGVTCSPFSGRA